MPEYISVPLIALVVIAVFVGMGLGWRRMNRRDSELQPLSVPDDVGDSSLSVETLYVATTASESPLARLVIPGLGFRGRAQLSFYEGGVVLELAGGVAVFIPNQALRSAGTATVAIDRVVEKNGMVRFTWNVPVAGSDAAGSDAAGDPAPIFRTVDSYLRIVDPVASQAVLWELTRRTPERATASDYPGELLGDDSDRPGPIPFSQSHSYPRPTAAESEV